MWNPLASLPASNVGALAPYTPAVQPNPIPVAQQPPAQPFQPQLHPLFGHRQHRQGGIAGQIADPNSFQAAMQAWRGDRPGMPQGFDPMAAMGGQPGAPFDPRQMVQGWRTDAFDPWRQSMMDWRGDRPLRSDF